MRFDEIREELERKMGYKNTSPSTDIVDTINLAINKAYLGLAAEENWHWWLASVDVPVIATQDRISLPPNFTDVLSVRDSDNLPIHFTKTLDQIKYTEQLGDLSKRTAALSTVDPFTYYNSGTVSIAQDSDQLTLVGGGTFPAGVAGRNLEISGDTEPFLITERVDDTTVTVDHTRRNSSITETAFTIDKAGTRRLSLVPAVEKSDTYTIYYYFCPSALVYDSDEPMLPREFHYYLSMAPRATLLHGQEERMTIYQQAKVETAEILSQMRRRNHALSQNMQLQIAAYV